MVVTDREKVLIFPKLNPIRVRSGIARADRSLKAGCAGTFIRKFQKEIKTSFNLTRVS